MKSYLQILNEQAETLNVPLLKAFKSADIPTSTYYRAINGATELRHDTAARVMNGIKKVHALQQARDYTAELRASGKQPDRSEILGRYKSGIVSASDRMHDIIDSQMGDT